MSVILSAVMLAMENSHVTQLAAVKEANENELMKVQQENYMLSVVSDDALIVTEFVYL